MNATTVKQSKKLQYTIPLVVSLVITLCLGYIDEGYYNFKFLLDIGNIIALSVYFFFIFLIQWLAARFLFHKAGTVLKWVLSAVAGIPLGISIAVAFFMWLKYLQS